jgi:hypothetical protein
MIRFLFSVKFLSVLLYRNSREGQEPQAVLFVMHAMRVLHLTVSTPKRYATVSFSPTD